MRRVQRVQLATRDGRDLLDRQAPLARLQVRLVPLVPREHLERLLPRVLLAQQDLRVQRALRDQRDTQGTQDPQDGLDPLATRDQRQP